MIRISIINFSSFLINFYQQNFRGMLPNNSFSALHCTTRLYPLLTFTVLLETPCMYIPDGDKNFLRVSKLLGRVPCRSCAKHSTASLDNAAIVPSFWCRKLTGTRFFQLWVCITYCSNVWQAIAKELQLEDYVAVRRALHTNLPVNFSVNVWNLPKWQSLHCVTCYLVSVSSIRSGISQNRGVELCRNLYLRNVLQDYCILLQHDVFTLELLPVCEFFLSVIVKD